MAMIVRINLLPVRQGKKREVSRQFLVLTAAVIVLVLVGNYIFYERVNGESERNTAKINQTQARIGELEKVIGEVNNLNARKKEVEDKLKILSGLRKGRSGPVRLMNVVWTPKGMGRLVEQKRDAKTSRVELLAAGNSIEDFAVADVGSFFTNIELRHAEQKDAKTTAGITKSVDFEIVMSVNYSI